MPVIQPAELWKRTGRYAIEELFKLKDRRGAELVLAMTHEEVVTSHVAQVVRSYRDLPLILYHFQVKGRDEPRPRAGVLRTREFVMKDSYSFDRDQEGLERSYAAPRRGLRPDLRAHRPALVSRRRRRRADGGDRRARVHGALRGRRERGRAGPGLCRQHRGRQRAGPGGRAAGAAGGARSRRHARMRRRSPRSAELFGLPAGAMLKAFPVRRRGTRSRDGDAARRPPRQRDQARGGAGLAVAAGERRGDRGRDRPARASSGRSARSCRCCWTTASAEGAYVVGANRAGTHLRGVEPGRDFSYERADVRTVEAGDLVGGAAITIEPAIEVGNIFQLGTRYSKALGASYLDEQGNEQPIWMGSYGIGMARIAAAAVEQFADERGISWPAAIAPFDGPPRGRRQARQRGARAGRTGL